MDDNLALLVGRIMLEWGNLDQQLYGHIQHLQSRADEQTPVDDRFTYRRRHFRRLVAESPLNAHLLPEVDRIYTALDRVEKQRAHLAHGSIYESGGRIRVMDWREINLFSKAVRAIPLSRISIKQLRERHVDIAYSPDDLRGIAEELSTLRGKLSAVFGEAMLRDRWPKLGPLR